MYFYRQYVYRFSWVARRAFRWTINKNDIIIYSGRMVVMSDDGSVASLNILLHPTTEQTFD